jgi:ferredoxin
MFLKTLKNLFKPKQTAEGFRRDFPKERMGHVVYDPSKCIKCHLCVKHCPPVAISVNPDKTVKVDRQKCIRCGICTRLCPTGALTMKKE